MVWTKHSVHFFDAWSPPELRNVKMLLRCLKCEIRIAQLPRDVDIFVLILVDRDVEDCQLPNFFMQSRCWRMLTDVWSSNVCAQEELNFQGHFIHFMFVEQGSYYCKVASICCIYIFQWWSFDLQSTKMVGCQSRTSMTRMLEWEEGECEPARIPFYWLVWIKSRILSNLLHDKFWITTNRTKAREKVNV